MFAFLIFLLKAQPITVNILIATTHIKQLDVELGLVAYIPT